VAKRWRALIHAIDHTRCHLPVRSRSRAGAHSLQPIAMYVIPKFALPVRDKPAMDDDQICLA
jgi:hypothetical protein